MTGIRNNHINKTPEMVFAKELNAECIYASNLFNQGVPS